MSARSVFDALFRRRHLEREMAKEMRHHVELETEARIRAGAPPDDARRQALVAFGGVEQMKERVRDERRTRWLEVAAAESRAAFSRLRRHPGFAIGAALSLALGMSIATAVFSMVNALFLRPLPYPEPDRLVHFYRFVPGAVFDYNTVSARQFVSLLDDAKSFQSIAASRLGTPRAVIGESGDAAAFDAVDITPNYFDVLGVRPMLGRSFTESDARLGSNRPVIIGYSLWQSRFAGDPHIVGRAARISGAPHTVIGVMPKGFDFPWGSRLWLPFGIGTIRQEAESEREAVFGMYPTIARLAPGVTTQRATAEADLLLTRLDPATAARPDRFHARVISLAAHVTRGFRESVGLWIAAAIVIAILCAVNFTTMSLARGMRRRGEIAVRAAMGAPLPRLVALLASEGAIIALLGGVLSVVFAYWLITYSSVWLDTSLPVSPTMDWRTIGFGIAVTTAVGALCALAPAIDLSKTDLRSLIAGDATTTTVGGRELRSRRGLVATQVALALAAVAVVVSLVQADRRMQAYGPGYDYSTIVTGDIAVVDSSALPGASARIRDFFLAAPGVSNATVVRAQPNGSRVVGITSDVTTTEAFMNWHDVDPDFFTTLGVHPITGRLPTPEEVSSHAPVMVLSKTTAYFSHFADTDPVGHRIRLRRTGAPAAWYTVIGVVPDVRFGPRFDPMSPAVYTFATIRQTGHLQVFSRLRGDPRAQLHALSTAVKALDSRLIVSNLQPVTQQVDDWRTLTSARTLFLTMVSVLALLLAILGVFGLTSFTAEMRLREIGVRIALGAPRTGLVRVIAGELWWMGCVGVAAGYLISSRVTLVLDARFANPLVRTPVVVFQVVPTALSAFALVLIAAAGTYVPLRRALRMDVMRALQSG